MRAFLIALSAYLGDVIARFRRWFTFRRIVGIVLFLTVLLLFRQFIALGLDVSFLLGLDLGLVAEVTALLILVSVRQRLITVTYAVRHGLTRIKPLSRLLRRSIRRAIRSRAVRPILPAPAEDDAAAWAFASVGYQN